MPTETISKPLDKFNERIIPSSETSLWNPIPCQSTFSWRISAFWIAIQHVQPLAVGLNCCEGPDVLRPFVAELADSVDCFTSCYPNAGLPNPLAPTGFDLGPADMAAYMGEFAQAGLLNIAGGCCGNTPGHLAAIAGAVRKHAPRKPRSLTA